MTTIHTPTRPSMLDLLGNMALARAIAPNDKFGAFRLASEAFMAVAEAAFTDPDLIETPPWPVRADLALLHAYEKAFQLRKLSHDKLEEHEALNAAWESKRKAQEADRAAKQQERLKTEQSAESMLADLITGKTLVLNGHSLAHDEDFDGLSGTNSYGHDYFAGQTVLATVTRWRRAMLGGEIWGPHESLSDGHDERGDSQDPELEFVEEELANIDFSYWALASMSNLWFTADFTDVVIAGYVGEGQHRPIAVLQVAETKIGDEFARFDDIQAD